MVMLTQCKVQVTIKLCLCVLLMNTAVVLRGQNIIPKPQRQVLMTGSFILNNATQLNVDPAFLSEASFLTGRLLDQTGFQLQQTKGDAKSQKTIVIRKAALNKGKEAYQLTVTPKEIVIEANDAAGIFYGCISLLQLLPVANTSGLSEIPVQAINITDQPRFAWRGLMLDVSRTFMPVAYLKKTLDRMAFYKLNVLHLHMSDDQGWRVPIKALPQLEAKATHFDSSYHEPKEYEGYYTTADISELVKYAESLHVEIVPEIESPGHSHAALFAYPELSCTGNVVPVYPFFSGPSVTNDVFCVGNPGSQQFFKAAIDEVAQAFPSKYLHLGGDEVPREAWQQCPKCQSLVKSAGLKNTSELQGYFMQQLREDVISNKKRPVAWDEILHDNRFLTKDWVIMSWTGSKPGWEAASKGYDVVMTPTSHMYFDYGYDATNSRKLFSFDPLEGCPDSSKVAKHILGIQANFWSHIDRTQSKIDYQLYPRLLALAERAWSDEGNKDYEDFRRRRDYHRDWLQKMTVKYFSGDFN